MAQQIEIEFKNSLTKEQYEQLLSTFNVTPEQIHLQANHYFDTPDFQLKDLHCGLRIRQIDHYYECTLKERSAEHEHLETTDVLNKQQALIMLEGGELLAPSVEQRLSHLQINKSALNIFGSLATNRVEIPYKEGTLVLDHSFYLQHEDYEVEYETNDIKRGYTIFSNFLKEHGIPIQPADKKIARFMKALAEKHAANDKD